MKIITYKSLIPTFELRSYIAIPYNYKARSSYIAIGIKLLQVINFMLESFLIPRSLSLFPSLLWHCKIDP